MVPQKHLESKIQPQDLCIQARTCRLEVERPRKGARTLRVSIRAHILAICQLIRIRGDPQLNQRSRADAPLHRTHVPHCTGP
jgi:hypothetical protein